MLIFIAIPKKHYRCPVRHFIFTANTSSVINTISVMEIYMKGVENMEKKENTMATVEIDTEAIEGYDFCVTMAQTCMNDCLGPWHGTPILNDLH